MNEPTHETGRTADPSRDPVDAGRDRARRWHEATLALSLAVFPGCAHLYVGQVARGLVWSCIFLGAVLPLGFFLFFTWAFSNEALFWVLLAVGALLLLGGIGPALRAFRGRAPTNPDRRRSRVVITGYACVVALAVLAESGWFLVNHLDTVRVSSLFLEPIAHQGEHATVLLSGFTRPVHGEVILFARSSSRPPPRKKQEPGLGRILAKPGDAVSLRDDRVFVNGVRLDLQRTDQRRTLEKAGRRLRRRRFLERLFTRADDLAAIRTEGLHLGGADWSIVLPPKSYLVLPDVNPAATDGAARPPLEGKGEDAPSPIPTAWLVDRSEILGRMIPWQVHF